MKPTLRRSRLPVFLRWLRLFGYNVKAYECAFCGRLSIIRRPAENEPTASRSRFVSRTGGTVAAPRSSTRRRSRVLAAIALLGLVMIIAAVAAVQLFQARHLLLAGEQQLRTAVDVMHSPSRLSNGGLRRTVRADLIAAEGDFAGARSDLWFWFPLLKHLGWVPVKGGELASASPAADTAFYATRSALHLVDGLSPLWPVLQHRGKGPPMFERLAPALQAGRSQFLLAQSDANQAALALNQLPIHSGNPSLYRARVQLRSILPVMRAADRWLLAAPTALGISRPSHYLVIFQDSAELRATGGFIGAADFLTVQHGMVHSALTGSILPRDIGSVVTPLPEALYTFEGPWIFRDSNWSPDLPLSARLERWFFGEDTGRWADGVISVVDASIGPILAGTGPVYLPAYHQWVSADNVSALAQRYVNGRYPGPIRQGSPDTIRKQFFGHVLTALVQRVQSLPLDRWSVLGQALSSEIARRDLMLYDRRPAIRAAIRMSGADGSLTAAPGDLLAIVDDNRSYNKLNPYVHESATYHVDIRPNLSLDATLTIHYRVAPSPANLEGAGPGFGFWGSKHDYQDFLRVYVPRGAQLQQATGLDVWAPESAYGLTQFAGRMRVREGRMHTVTIRYRIPANVFSASQFERYLLTVRHQPGGNLSSVRLSVHGADGIALRTPRGPTTAFARTLPLDRDARLDLSVSGATNPAVEPLQRQSGPIDPYIPFSYLRDSRHPF
jgi:hypothetical protein